MQVQVLPYPPSVVRIAAITPGCKPGGVLPFGGSSPPQRTSVHDCNWQTYLFQKQVLEGSSPSVRTNL